ncbi:unnamed protein product, partial [Ixodes hexagonus]
CADVTYTLLCTLVLGPVLGKLAGHVLAFTLIKLSQDVPVAFVVSVSSVMATWTFAERFLYGCGVTTVISMALATNAHATSTIHNPMVMKKFWVLVRFVYNTVLVFLASYVIGRDTLQYLTWNDVMSPINSYVAKIGVRFMTTIIMYPIIASVGYQLSWQQCLIIAWANFKGAIMISLSLSQALSGINLELALKEQFVRLGTLFLVQLLNTTTLPKLMSMLGLMTLSDVERSNMSMVIQALRETACTSTDYQRRDKKFSGADWKWVQMHTYIDNPHAAVEEEEHVEQADAYVPARVYRNAAARKASCSILRLQKVCYNKQFEEGMIHKRTKTTILAALQYPLEKETYLDYKMMMPYITVPEWIYRLKDLVQRFAGNEAIEKRHTVSSKTDLEDEFIEQVRHFEDWCTLCGEYIPRGCKRLSHVLHPQGCTCAPQREVHICTLLSGVHVHPSLHPTTQRVYRYAHFLGVQIFPSLHLHRSLGVRVHPLFGCTDIPFPTPSPFTAAIAVRLFIQVVDVGFIPKFYSQGGYSMPVRLCDRLQLDGGLCFVIGWNSWGIWGIAARLEENIDSDRYVTSSHYTKRFRSKTSLETTDEKGDISQRYPNIEVATKTRQAARRILNKAVDGLRELHEGGLIDDKQYGILFEDLSWMIQRADGMPTNIVVGNAPFFTMLSVPWLPAEDVSRLLKSCYHYIKEKELLVERDRTHDCVFIICSGIVKVSGVNEEPWTNVGHLCNSDSTHYFFTEGPFEDFLVAPESLGLLCFLTGKPSVCECVCETDVEV